ncbi:MAG: NADPH:quinone oxidoreductase family protein [Acidimicrobiales bacterium]|jgi:NADPH2:quinone reductase
MRAVVCNELGPLDTLVVEERPTREPGEGMVVVDVAAAGVNFVDGLICQGRYQLKPATPFVPGSEVAGTVSAVGPGVTDHTVGDRVLVFCGFGGFASQVVVPALSLVAVPEAIDLAQAAALVQSYCTALFTLTHRTTVDPDEWVLVLGAGGGIGLAAVDVATALGARVIAAASTPDKLAAAVAMGAAATIAYEDEDLKTRARELSGGGVDVVVDPVGGVHAEPALRATRHMGRFCVIGFASGTIPSIPANLVLLNNRTLIGVDWGGWTFKDPLGNRALVDELMGMVAAGRLHPIRPATRPLEDAAVVMEALIDRTIAGKVVLVP